jgi:hypothetical protein
MLKTLRTMHYNFGLQPKPCRPFLHFERVSIGKNRFVFIHFFHLWLDLNWHLYD